MTVVGRGRRAYIDWLRGLAVLVMIFAHTTDAWTRPADRGSALYDLFVKIAGMGAPLFLFLAGLAVVLSASAKLRKGATASQAAAAVRRRGWEILGLAFLFRLQAWVLSPGSSPASMLKVDILNVMGPAMVIAATMWQWTARPWPRVVTFAAVASAFSFLTPLVRSSAFLAAVPDPLEWYLRPPAGRSWFTMFPWAGLLIAGGIVGELVDRHPGERAERRLIAALGAGGTFLLAVSLACSYLPSLFQHTYFWTTGPSYFFARIGLMTAMLAVAWLWCRRLDPARFSPMLQFGRTSLFVYWIHVEMVYGYLSWPLHRALPIGWALVAFLLFTAVMLAASVAKDRAVARWRARSPRPLR